MQHTVPFDSCPKNEPPPHPGEDQSSKRAKLDEEQASGDNMEADASSLPVSVVPETQMTPEIPSTKEAQMDEAVGHANPGDVSIGFNGNVPTVDFANHVLEAMNQRIGLAVVVKLLGRRIGYRHLRTQLQNLWKPIGQLKIIDLADDCYLVRFSEDIDYQNALLSGPWMVFGHYLTVQPWSPSFRSHEHTIHQIIGWVRLPRLPARYYHKSVIRSIGSVFGDVIRVDYNTESGDRGKFARLAVCLDLTKPLISKILVDGELIFVEYEGLSSICFNCGRYGHLQDLCPEKMAATSEVADAPGPAISAVPRPPTTMQSRDTACFGEWMQVQRRPRRMYDKPEGPTGFVQDKENHPLMSDSNFQRRKGKETKGPPRSDSVSRQKLQNPQAPNHDCIFNSPHYTSRPASTSLDETYHSTLLVTDPRLPHSHQKHPAKQSGLDHQPKHGNDPHSTSRGFKLASGVAIHNLGARPNLSIPGPSVHTIKQIARELQSDPDTPITGALVEGVCSSQWAQLFPLYEINHLPKILSDHRPVLIKLGLSPASPRPHHFRFFAHWLSHQEFSPLVLRIWEHVDDIFRCLDAFSVEAKRWDSVTFGEIGRRKRRLLSRIRGIQMKLEDPTRDPNDSLLDLELILTDEFEQVCFHEELLWFQKSSSEWLCLGDRNTQYYHLKALMRRKKKTGSLSSRIVRAPGLLMILSYPPLQKISSQIFTLCP
ncbi:hypothetical protein K1719_031560 [Acacia pycnantha]|nr:hypothetical protein K1719_031560 [Acacia pycnantha]